jgi:heterodisulfide reductase subunit A2
MKRHAVIIGGGIGGLSCAAELSRLGLESIVVEKADTLGGHAAGLCCKATDQCQRCGACLWEDVLQSVKESNNIFTMTNTVLGEAQASATGWRLGLSQIGTADQTEVEAAAVIVASGFGAFDPRKKPQFGYGRIPGVVTALELESRIRADSWDREIKSVAFIQCVGSRDPKIGNNYCSRVCCAYALRLGRLLKSRFSDVKASIFYMDIQSFDRDFDSRMKAAQKEMSLIRAIPSQIREGADGRPELVYHGPEDERIFETYDIVVLSVGMTPGESAASLADLLGLGFTSDGFFGKNGESADTGRNGLFVTGAAQGPRSIEDTITDAVCTAGRAASYIRKTQAEEDQ